MQQILIVEDNLVNRKVLSKILCDEYSIIEAEDGETALNIIREKHEQIAAVILDLCMPGMDGRELLQILAMDKDYENLPILVATGENDENVESQCLALGAWDFVTKPYKPAILLLRLRNIIGRSQVYLMKKIRTLAERDHLTGIYNRDYFMEQTKKMILDNPDIEFVLVRMDIDHFKMYNSSFGTEAGDLLLKRIANLLKIDTAEYYTFGRIESDVFCVCTAYVPEKVIETLYRAEDFLQSYSTSYRLKFSFGLYIIENRELEMEKMYSCATQAARKCKHNINHIYTFYNDEMTIEEEQAQIITNEMERALSQEQFQVYLQPKYSLEDDKPCGAEALVRWIHPQRGIVSPSSFIPIVEKNGYIVQLDYYMWEHVCMLLQKWIQEGRKMYPLSVNISRVSLYNPQIVERIVELTKRYNVPREYLNLEVTESAYMSNPELMKKIIRKLREAGFLIMMDDFGSGYSSLNTLKNIDVDILKVDMKFLPNGSDNVKSEKILASVVRMAGWIGMPVVVEGVESQSQKDFLDSIGCRFVQGYYYAKPMPVDEYEHLIDEMAALTCLPSDIEEFSVSDLDVVWSSNAKVVSLLKSVSIPFSLFEYHQGLIDVLRTNQAYIKEFGASKELNHQLNHQERYKLVNAIDQAVYTKECNECECLLLTGDGAHNWYRIRLLYVGVVAGRSLVSATFMNVTAERRLENELNVIFSSLKEKTIDRPALLVVEDSELSQEMLRGMFENKYEMISAYNGQEGLELLEKHQQKISAILLDMVMPQMDGQEFLFYKNQMKDVSEIPVIVISSENSENLQINMLQNGVNDYVTKPFLPALVQQRVNNVIEYHSRFSALVKEYHQTEEKLQEKVRRIRENGYAMDEIKSMMLFLDEIFDAVRLVDPKDTAVITINKEGSIRRKSNSCYKIWGKTERCEHCTSISALAGQCTLSKYELMRNDVFYAVSKPITVHLTDALKENLVLEISSKISSEATMQLIQGETDKMKLDHAHEMIYTDPLTGAYNRRFFDEKLFLHHGQSGMATRVGLILMDLYKFKQINDLFGHQVGDKVLSGVVMVMRRQLRNHDSVIRYGGDEFIIIMTNCAQDQIPMAVERLQRAVETVRYGPNNTISAKADFGYAYTDAFIRNSNMLEGMLGDADRKMYERKNQHRNQDK